MSGTSRAVEKGAVTTPVDGHFLVAPPAAGEPAPQLIGFHGYGETAQDHLDELLRIPGVESWLVASVQGLHPFYRRSTGQVVASWMTSFERQRAIAENRRYVARAVAEIRRRYPVTDTLVYAGFSQGVAMTYRAVGAEPGEGFETPPPAAGLIALAGDVPPEVGADPPRPFPRVLLGRGSEDAWYDAKKMEGDESTLAASGVSFESFVFDAGHVWTDSFRERAGRFLAEIASST